MPFRTWTDPGLQFIGGKVYICVCLNFLFLEERWRQRPVRHRQGCGTQMAAQREEMLPTLESVPWGGREPPLRCERGHLSAPPRSKLANNRNPLPPSISYVRMKY